MLFKKASRSPAGAAAAFLMGNGWADPGAGGGGGGIGAPAPNDGGGGGGGGAPDAGGGGAPDAGGGGGGGGGAFAFIEFFGFWDTCTGGIRACTGASLIGGGVGCLTGAYSTGALFQLGCTGVALIGAGGGCLVGENSTGVLFPLGTIVGFGGAGGATRIVPTLRCVWDEIVAYVSFCGLSFGVERTSVADG